ncbi:MAG TPA: zf-HC2 domain-containing protein [Anaerolineales bacterium]|nr:zf-HC2 domain-containing protein [Anaerolineales bacterium]
MNHLTETQLNEYLDDTLSAARRTQVEAHLSTCAACRAELKALRGVFQALAALPEASLPRDLTPSVIRNASGQTIAFGWRLALAAQAGLAIGLIVVFARIFSSMFHPSLVLQPLLAGWISLVGPISFGFPTIHFPKLVLPGLRLPIPTSAAAILLAVVVLLWVLGNSRLLRNGSEVNR